MEILENFFHDKPIKKAYLFGSYSRNQANGLSDVDILVELDYTAHIGLGFIRMKNQLEELLSRKVDLVSQAGVSKHILPFINNDKLLIYER